MPILSSSEYNPSYIFKNGHRNTLISHILRPKGKLEFARRRLTTPDDDFIDVDCLSGKNNQLIILCHGLEGSSSSSYIQGFASYFHAKDFDVAALNYRGCSGEMNRQLRLYHSGSTNDIDLVVQAFATQYDSLFLIGFSLGGNLVLKYLGEPGQTIPSSLKAAVAFSTPSHLESCSLKIIQRQNWIYEKRFLISLTKKLKAKAQLYPESIDLTLLKKTKTLYDFDNYFTAPIHGFKDAIDYYTQCSSKQYLANITLPTLMISSYDDPFLSKEAIPTQEADENDNLFLYPCTYGGHLGFYLTKSKNSWMEIKSEQFIQQFTS